MKELVIKWFEIWENGNFIELPITPTFEHHSPFGIIKGKDSYLDLVKKNRHKFLGHTFKIQDACYELDKACVRYTSSQGSDFKLDVSEWYYADKGLLKKVVAYYHIGEIREERKLDLNG